MQFYQQAEDITVIGIRVINFPGGIKEAFESLIKTLGNEHSYYGISWMGDADSIEYFAMANEIMKGEGLLHSYETLTITSGEYKTKAIHNWMDKTETVKDVFHELMGNSKPGKKNPCIEWYKSDEEMICMVKV